MSNEKSLRAFLAIEPPVEILREIGNIQNLLQKSCPADIRWTRPEGIHLTLKFFGDISEMDIPVISRAVEKHTAAILPIHLKASTLGVFPSLKRPRVIWIGLQGGGIAPLVVLQKNLESAFEDYGFTREERVFLPHLTLGRIKAENKGGLRNILETGKDFTAGSFLSSGLGLFKSDLTPRGAIYTKLVWFPFGGKEVQ